MEEVVERLGAFAGVAAAFGVLVLAGLHLSTRRDLKRLLDRLRSRDDPRRDRRPPSR